MTQDLIELPKSFVSNENNEDLECYDSLAEKMPGILNSLLFLYREARSTENDDIAELIGNFYKMVNLVYGIIEKDLNIKNDS